MKNVKTKLILFISIMIIPLIGICQSHYRSTYSTTSSYLRRYGTNYDLKRHQLEMRRLELIRAQRYLNRVTYNLQNSNYESNYRTPNENNDTSLIDFSYRRPIMSMYYNGNFTQSLHGGGFLVHFGKLGKISMLMNWKWGYKTSGQYKVAYQNLYTRRIGSFGNKPTGNSDWYTENDINRFDFGLGYLLYKDGDLFIRPYLGFGITSDVKDTETYLEAEDITSGVNAYGRYWVVDSKKTEYNRYIGTTFGFLIEKGYLTMGLGYDVNPSGLSISLGFNF